MTLTFFRGLWLRTARVDPIFLLVFTDVFLLFPVLLHTNGVLFVFWGWGVLCGSCIFSDVFNFFFLQIFSSVAVGSHWGVIHRVD